MKYLVAALAFACTLAIGSAIKCYTCNSGIDQGCEDPFDPTKAPKTMECTHGCQKIKGKQGSAQIVSRQCSMLPLTEENCETKSEDGNEAHLCFCTKELCNAGVSTQSFGFLIISSVGIVLINWLR